VIGEITINSNKYDSKPENRQRALNFQKGKMNIKRSRQQPYQTSWTSGIPGKNWKVRQFIAIASAKSTCFVQIDESFCFCVIVTYYSCLAMACVEYCLARAVDQGFGSPLCFVLLPAPPGKPAAWFPQDSLER
jgi:hypothetical protein